MLLSREMNKSLKFFVLLRTSLVFYVAYMTNISDMWKIILLILFDVVDCDLPKIYKLFTKSTLKIRDNDKFINNEICRSFDYQIHDKVNDLITLGVIYHLFMNKINNMKYINYILPLSLIWRSIGVYKFYHNKDRNIFISYPDLFRELFIYSFIIGFKTPNMIVILLIVILKIAFEKYWHDIKINHNTLTV